MQEAEHLRFPLAGGRQARVLFSGPAPGRKDLEKLIEMLHMVLDQYPVGKSGSTRVRSPAHARQRQAEGQCDSVDARNPHVGEVEEIACTVEGCPWKVFRCAFHRSNGRGAMALSHHLLLKHGIHGAPKPKSVAPPAKKPHVAQPSVDGPASDKPCDYDQTHRGKTKAGKHSGPVHEIKCPVKGCNWKVDRCRGHREHGRARMALSRHMSLSHSEEAKTDQEPPGPSTKFAKRPGQLYPSEVAPTFIKVEPSPPVPLFYVDTSPVRRAGRKEHIRRQVEKVPPPAPIAEAPARSPSTSRLSPKELRDLERDLARQEAREHLTSDGREPRYPHSDEEADEEDL